MTETVARTVETPAKPNRFVEALKDGAVGGAITLLLCLPLLAYKTVESATSGLELESRWMLVVFAVGIVAVGRALLSFFVWQSGKASGFGVETFGSVVSKLGFAVGPLLLIIAVALPWTPVADRYIMDLAILVLTYVMLAWGLNIVVGLAGLLDLGYVAFYAVGAYSYALLAQNFGLSFWICLPLAGILAAFWGILLGFPVLRLRGDYLAIVTLAFGEIIRIVLLNWYEFTGGPDGLSRIPRPDFFGLEFKAFGDNTFASFFGIEHSSLHRIIFLYYIILILALFTNWVTIRLRRLPVGRAWEALREDEIACKSLGINTVTTKLTAFAIGAMFGGFAGAFFATKQGFISPESFTFIESAIILAIVVLGGMGSQIGIAVAAVLMIGGIEVFRELEEFRMLIFGLAMVLVMVWRPRGLVSSRTPSVALKKRKAIGADMVGEGSG
ncbi:MAG: high-affinity branched-chain amino acid ABC transporter permease LivM [Pseudomonadota bacterium]